MQYYKIIISEPWDYVDSKGNNIISGQPITLLDPDGNWERNAGGNLVA